MQELFFHAHLLLYLGTPHFGNMTNVLYSGVHMSTETNKSRLNVAQYIKTFIN